MFLNLHFNIKPSKLTKMPVREGVFCPKDRSDLKYSSEITTY